MQRAGGVRLGRERPWRGMPGLTPTGPCRSRRPCPLTVLLQGLDQGIQVADSRPGRRCALGANACFSSCWGLLLLRRKPGAETGRAGRAQPRRNE